MATRTKKMSVIEALKVMQFQEEVTKQVAQARYRDLASMYHPDKTQLPADEAHEKMVQLNAAWAVLRKVLKGEADKQEKAEKKEKADTSTYTVSPDGLSVKMAGVFSTQEIIEVLYSVGAEHMQAIGDAVKNTAQMVDFFRALNTGRKNKVHSLALLDARNKIIRMEELTEQYPDIRALATQCLLHGAVKLYLIVNSTDGSVPKRVSVAHTEKVAKLQDALAGVGVDLLDSIIIGHAGYFSIRESKGIAKTA